MPIDETRCVSVAWELFQSGVYFVPTNNFEIHTYEPPPLFWTIDLAEAVFRVSESASRVVGPP